MSLRSSDSLNTDGYRILGTTRERVVSPVGKGGNLLSRNQQIAIVVIIVIAIGGIAGYMLLFPPAAPEDVIIVGTTDTVEASIDPAQSYDYFGWQIISALSSKLVEIDPGSEGTADDIMPALATSWTRSTDGKTWDFTLRQGVAFFDGREFNSSIVKYSFDRNCNLTGTGLQEPDGPQFNMGYADIIDNVTETGRYSVRFYLKIAFAPFLQLMACAASTMVDPDYAPLADGDPATIDYVQYTAGDPRASHPNGLGSYVLTEWVRTGGEDESMTLEANEAYWDYPNLPKTDKIIIQFYEDEASLAAAMTAGDIDVAYRHLTPQQVDGFRDNAAYTVWEGIGAAIQYMLFQQRIYPYNETIIRQGIAAALNRSNVAETVFVGTVDPLYSIIPAGMAFHKPSFEVYGDANYTFTQTALATKGYNSTNKLVIELYYESSGHYPSSAEQAAVYKSDLEASGVITVNLHNYDWPTYREHRNAGDMDVFIYGWYPDFIDPDNYGFLPFASWLNLGYNSTYPQGGIDQNDLWVEGRSAEDDPGRQAAYYALQDLQAEEVSCIPLWQGQTNAVSVSGIVGIVLDITVDFRYWLLDWST
jgi:peptide/nickel transport system substrate-binding protein